MGSRLIDNEKVQNLISNGKKHDCVYFKGAIGDRYTIYVHTKTSKNKVEIYAVYNGYDYGTDDGKHLATIKDNVLKFIDSGNKSCYGLGHTVKQLMRQGVVSRHNPWKIRFCRSCFFIRLADGSEFNPFPGMRLSFDTGKLLNKHVPRLNQKHYKKAKETDRVHRKANRLANKNNTEAIKRYKDAGGEIEGARSNWHNGSWQPAVEGAGTESINWDMIPIDDVFKHRNVTLRSNILQHYGISALLETLKYETVDVDIIDGREYRLLNVLIPDFSGGQLIESNGLYLQMINPSTGESHFEGIQNVDSWGGPKEATVKQALAWRDGDELMQGNNDWRARQDNVITDYVIPSKLT